MGVRKCNVLASSQQYLNANYAVGQLVTVNSVHLGQSGQTCSGDICCTYRSRTVGQGGRSVYRICISVSRSCDLKGTLKHQARSLCVFPMLFIMLV